MPIHARRMGFVSNFERFAVSSAFPLPDPAILLDFRGSSALPRKRCPGDKFAEQAGLAKPLVRRRVLELAQTVPDSIAKITIKQEVAQNVAALIRKRCETTLKRFAD
jgi:hypothetical protein